MKTLPGGPPASASATARFSVRPRSFRRLIVAASVAASLVAPFGFYRRDNYACSRCSTSRIVREWRLSIRYPWPSSAPAPSSLLLMRHSSIARSAEPLSAPHNHHWRFLQGSGYAFWGLAFRECANGLG